MPGIVVIPMKSTLRRHKPLTAHQIIVSLLAFGLLLVSCDSAVIGDPALGMNLNPDPVFRPFYESLGGMIVLGPVISEAKTIEGRTYQYTQNALMVYNPQAVESDKYQLSPLGRDMQIEEPPIGSSSGTGELIIEGHVVYAGFIPLFQALGGTRYAGKPLSEVHYNPETQKYEQYFENIGIFQDAADPASGPRLLAYGAWKCNEHCRQPSLGKERVNPPAPVAAYFMDVVARLGVDFTGPALVEPRYTPDGYVEQIFGNLVLIADPDQPGRVFTRPISLEIGILPGSLTLSGGNPETFFLPLGAGDRGHNVPRYFLNYLALHGGLEAAGIPITELYPLKEGGFQQCFTNLCLNVVELEDGSLDIQPAQHGYTYRQLPPTAVHEALEAASQPAIAEMILEQAFAPTQENALVEVPQPDQLATESPVNSPDTPSNEPLPAASELTAAEAGHPITSQPQPAPPVQPLTEAAGGQQHSEPAASFSAEPAAVVKAESIESQLAGVPLAQPVEVVLEVWKSYAFVTPDQGQEIGVLILEDGMPVRGLDPNLTIEYPDGRRKTYYMYPTGDQGQSVMQIEPVDQPNGSTIHYQVCVFYPGGAQYCTRDSFMVWENP